MEGVGKWWYRGTKELKKWWQRLIFFSMKAPSFHCIDFDIIHGFFPLINHILQLGPMQLFNFYDALDSSLNIGNLLEKTQLIILLTIPCFTQDNID